MPATLNPDPSVIGGVPQAPLVLLPEPANLFSTRAKRFAFLSETSRLAPYLKFLADLSLLQARLVQELDAAGLLVSPKAALPGMPPINRSLLIGDPVLADTARRLFVEASALDMPAPARLALEAVTDADPTDLLWLLSNILNDRIPEDSAAPHLFAAAAVQVHAARLAARLDPAGLEPIGTGVCPTCGGKPATSSVMTTPVIENVRYAACNCCATLWNEVRVKCLCCGSTKGITYRSAETQDATVKAEVCSECHSWVKIFYQVRNASLDPVADDVGSVGLDLMMKDSGLRRGGCNPYLAGF